MMNLDLCRNNACGCTVPGSDRFPVYCDMCKEFTPICPVCNAAYGEHRLNCTVADGYTDCGEGPWDTEEAARVFVAAEVGRPWAVVQSGGNWYVLTKEEGNAD